MQWIQPVFPVTMTRKYPRDFRNINCSKTTECDNAVPFLVRSYPGGGPVEFPLSVRPSTHVRTGKRLNEFSLNLDIREFYEKLQSASCD